MGPAQTRRDRRGIITIAFAVVFAFGGSLPAQAPPPLTLDDVLRIAHEANAHLPVAALNRDIAQEVVKEAQGRLKPRFFFDGDAHQGGPAAYTSGDGRLQFIGADTLYDGGRLRSNLRQAQHLARAAGAGFRLVEKDLDLDVRSLFAEAVHAHREIDIRRASLGRLQSYLSLIEAQRAGGVGVAGDVLKTRARVAAEEANIADAERGLGEADVELNDLMGRSPLDSLAIAVPPPTAAAQAPSPGTAPWLATPEIAVAQANLAAAGAAVDIAKADRRPQLSVTADVGWLPQLGSNGGAGLNTGTGTGAEITLWFNWPVLDFGVFRAHLAQAQLAARQSADSLTVVRRQSELEWSRAAQQLTDFSRVLQLRSQSVPIARDAYLQTEALYRGGVGAALDVIDAYAAWVDAQVAEADAELDVRQAEARLIRWGTP